MFIVVMNGVSHQVVRYETDLIEESGTTHCGIEFSLWEGAQGRSPIPTFDHLENEKGHAEFPTGMVRCERCTGMTTREECGCSA